MCNVELAQAVGDVLGTGVGVRVAPVPNLTTPLPEAPEMLAVLAPADKVPVSGSKAASGPAASERVTT